MIDRSVAIWLALMLPALEGCKMKLGRDDDLHGNVDALAWACGPSGDVTNWMARERAEYHLEKGLLFTFVWAFSRSRR